MSQAATERTVEKRSHAADENGDSNDAVNAKTQKLDNNKDVSVDDIVKDTPKTKATENVAPVVKSVDEVGAENDVEDEEGGDVEESSNAESGAEDEEGDIDDEEEDALNDEDGGEDDLDGGDDDEDNDGDEEEEEEEEE